MTCMTITMPNFKCLEQVFLELSSSSRYKNIVTVKYSSKTGIPPESTRNPESQPESGIPTGIPPESTRNPGSQPESDRNFRNRWGSVNYSKIRVKRNFINRQTLWGDKTSHNPLVVLRVNHRTQ